MRKNLKLLRWVFVLILCLGFIMHALTGVEETTHGEQESKIELTGSGTADDPYLVQNLKDLKLFRDYVNDGITFEDQYIYQTVNIDLDGYRWTPIGVDGAAFYGHYDGGGHYIENLDVPNRKDSENYNGFFGTLGGTVVNFGIESGTIRGVYNGSIASRSVGKKAAILNCYSKAIVYGVRAGGMADDFSDSVVASCWFDGETRGSYINAFLSYSGDKKVYHTYTTAAHAMTTIDVDAPTSSNVSREFLYTEDFVKNLNLSVAMTQYLFAANYGVELMQWDLDDSGRIVFSDSTKYIDFVGFLNSYLLPILLLLVIAGYCIAFCIVGKEQIWKTYGKDMIAIMIISGIVSVFLDCAIISKGLPYLNLGNGLFIFLSNSVFFATLYLVIRNCKIRISPIKDYVPICCAIIVISVLELFQFDLVPTYDAGIYYGSLVKAIDLFRVDLLTYIGAFACWKWIHGLVLLIAPVEFFMPGQMIGIYIANMGINAFAMLSFYWLVRKLCPSASPVLATLGSVILILCPYQLGLFTYLAMDPHTSIFLVWLLCSYKMKNPILVSFCGYLLAFNKITGLVYYVFFLLAMGVYELMTTEGKNILYKLINWWKWKTVLLWILPAVLFLMTMIIGEDFIIQTFYGSFTGASYALKNAHELMNTVLQGFVYGFRWLFMLILAIAVMLLLMKRRVLREILAGEDIGILVGSLVAVLGVLAVLCCYQGDADCPRYTAPNNLFFAMSFIVAVQIIGKRRIMQTAIAGGMAVLLLIQTYWTIDPVVMLTSDTIYTGKKLMYKFAPPGDSRWGMNLGKDYGPGYEVVGDLYTYNLEHSFYSSLIDDILTYIKPDADTQLVQLDVMWYETHIYGNKYPIFWNTRTNNRSYNFNDPDCLHLENHMDVFTEDICQNKVSFEDRFYMLVPARVDSTTALESLNLQGYELVDEIRVENMYGSLSAYEFNKQLREVK